jgi:hypothetical protein
MVPERVMIVSNGSLGTMLALEQVGNGIWAVTAAAGRGMTLSPAIAEKTWQEEAG